MEEQPRELSVTIREARAEDAAGIAWVHWHTWQVSYRGIVPDAYLAGMSYEQRKARWETSLRAPDPETCIFVAEDEAGAIVAFAVGSFGKTEDAEYRGELNALYVLPTHQRQEIGHRLARRVAQRLLQKGITTMLVWTLADGPSGRFYEALGGQRVREATRDFAGTELGLVAYGWPDVSTLIGPYPLGGEPVRYERPTDPVAEEDWEVLQG